MSCFGRVRAHVRVDSTCQRVRQPQTERPVPAPILRCPTSSLSGTATQHNEIKANLKHMSLDCLHTQLN